MTPFGQALVASGLTLVTVAVHATCTVGLFNCFALLRARKVRYPYSVRVFGIALLVIALVGASVLEAGAWAFAYLSIGAFDALEPALYFSIVTFTTLGYGDISPHEGWRMLAALQAANGIVIFGWTTALVIAAVQRLGTYHASET